MDKDFGCGHLIMTTCRGTTSVGVNLVQGIYHGLCRELKELLIEAVRQNVTEARKLFVNAMTNWREKIDSERKIGKYAER